jgi:O-antigen/teichoic acid export membrane protein
MGDPDEASSVKGGSLLKSLSWTALGELVFAATSLVVLVLLGQFGSASELGAYTLGLAIATPAIIFTNLHLRPAYVVEPAGRWEFGHYLALRVLGLPLMPAAVAILVHAVGYESRVASFVLAVALIRAAESASDICLAPPQRAENMGRIGVSRAARGMAQVVGLAMGLGILGDALAGVWIAAALSWLLTVTYDRRTLADYGGFVPRFEAPKLRALAVRTMPIGFGAGLLMLSTSVPAYAVESEHSLAVLGQFSALISIISIGGVVNVVVGNASIPRLARQASEGEKGFVPLLLKLLGLVSLAHAGIVGAVYLLGEYYLALYGNEFLELEHELRLVAWVGLGVGLTNLLSQTVTALGLFRVQFGVSALGLVLAVAVAALWVPREALIGGLGALAVLAAFRGLSYLAVLVVSSQKRS